MEIKWGYGAFRVPVVNEAYHTIKLRMNRSTWTFIQPKLDLSSVTVSEKNNYVTIVSVTRSSELYAALRRAIAEGQRDQVRKQLEMWEAHENDFKTPLKFIFNEVETSDELSDEFVNELTNRIVEDSTEAPECIDVESIVNDSILNKFIRCTEYNYKEVWDKLLELGLTTDGFTDPGWTDQCTGVATYYDNTFQCYNNGTLSREEMSIEEFFQKY
jgi:hypothetical protein